MAYNRTSVGLWVPRREVYRPTILVPRERSLWGTPYGGGSPIVPPAVVDYRTSATNNTDQTTYVFSSQDIGAAAANRIVVVAMHWAGSQTVSSASFAGVSATEANQRNSTGTGGAIFWAAVPTGTTGDISITMSGTLSRFGIGVWRVLYYVSATPSWNDETNAGTSAIALAATALNGGVIIGQVTGNEDNNSYTVANAAERYDTDMDLVRNVGFDHTCTVDESRTVTATEAGSASAKVMCLAHWR